MCWHPNPNFSSKCWASILVWELGTLELFFDQTGNNYPSQFQMEPLILRLGGALYLMGGQLPIPSQWGVHSALWQLHETECWLGPVKSRVFGGIGSRHLGLVCKTHIQWQYYWSSSQATRKRFIVDSQRWSQMVVSCPVRFSLNGIC